MFPEYYYPDCSESWWNDPMTKIIMDYENNTVSMDCNFHSLGRYTTGPIKNITFTNPLDLAKKWKNSRYAYHPQTINGDTDWAIGTCRLKSQRWELHYHVPRKNETRYKENLEKMDFFYQQSNNPPKKPMIMLNLSVDSFSRRHFFRKCKRTI